KESVLGAGEIACGLQNTYLNHVLFNPGFDQVVQEALRELWIVVDEDVDPNVFDAPESRYAGKRSVVVNDDTAFYTRDVVKPRQVGQSGVFGHSENAAHIGERLQSFQGGQFSVVVDRKAA